MTIKNPIQADTQQVALESSALEKDLYPITDWDDAYANADHIKNSASYPDNWQASASAFRQKLTAQSCAKLNIKYGSGERNTLDLFLPAPSQSLTGKGLVVFVHGGYWLRFDKSYWSHFAQGALDSGYAVAIPSYTLCPQISIAGITKEIAAAIDCAAGLVSGEIRLMGHSAGGHLVTSMLCDDSPLASHILRRIVKTVSISGVHDLRALTNTAINKSLQLTSEQARACSPVLKAPGHLMPLTCWVGSEERPEFKRLNKLQAQIWQTFSLSTDWVEESGKQHFNILDGLLDKNHPLMRSLLC